MCGSHPGDDNTSIMLPVVKRGLSRTELQQTTWATHWHWYHQTVLGHFLMEVSLRLPSSYLVPCLYTSNNNCVGVLAQLGISAIYLTSPKRAKLGLQMGKPDLCSAKSSWGLGSTIPHPKLPYEVWLSAPFSWAGVWCIRHELCIEANTWQASAKENANTLVQAR